jgi:hypothetical protein
MEHYGLCRRCFRVSSPAIVICKKPVFPLTKEPVHAYNSYFKAFMERSFNLIVVGRQQECKNIIFF